MNTGNPHAHYSETTAAAQVNVCLLFADNALGNWLQQLLSFNRSPAIAVTQVSTENFQTLPPGCDLLITDGDSVLFHRDAVFTALSRQANNPRCLLVIKDEQLPALMPQLANLARLGVDQFTLYSDVNLRLIIELLTTTGSLPGTLNPVLNNYNALANATASTQQQTLLANETTASAQHLQQLHAAQKPASSGGSTKIVHPIAIDLSNQRIHVESVAGSLLCADEDILEPLDNWYKRLSTESKQRFEELLTRAQSYEPVPKSLTITLSDLANQSVVVSLEAIQLKNNGQGRVMGASADLHIAPISTLSEYSLPNTAMGFDNLSDSSELIETSKIWQNITRSLPMQCLLLDEEGLVVQVINEGDRNNPCLPSLMVGAKLTELLSIDSLDDLTDTIRRTVNTGKPHHQVIAYASDHGLRWLDTHITKLGGDSGLSRQVVWTAFDITSSRHAYQELLKSRDSIAHIIDDAPFLFFQKDSAGRYLRANKKFCRFFNVNIDAIASHTDSEIFGDSHPEFARVTERAMAMVESHTSTEESVVYTQEVDGEPQTFHWQILLGKRNTDSHIDTLCGFGIATQGITTQASTATGDNVQALEQPASLSMSGALQQDLKIILNALVDYAELGLSQKNPRRNASIIDALAQIESTAKRTHDMMRAEPATDEPQQGFEPEPVVRDIVDMLSPTLPASLTIETQLHAAGQRAEVDINAFKQIVMLLLLNAKSNTTQADVQSSTGVQSSAGDNRILIELVTLDEISETCSACGEALRGNFLSLSVETPTPSIDEEGFQRLIEAAQQSWKSSNNNVIALSHRAGGHVLIQQHKNATKLQLLFPQA